MNITSLIKAGFISSIALIFASSINTSSAAKLYKWVDDRGRISYQDKPPPVNSKILSEKTIKDRSGNQSKVQRSINTNPIDVYVTKSCPSCDKTLKMLEDWGVPYTVKAIEGHRGIQTRLLQLTDGINVPALFYDDKFLSDTLTQSSLRESLKQTGHFKESIPKVTEGSKESTPEVTDELQLINEE